MYKLKNIKIKTWHVVIGCILVSAVLLQAAYEYEYNKLSNATTNTQVIHTSTDHYDDKDQLKETVVDDTYVPVDYTIDEVLTDNIKQTASNDMTVEKMQKSLAGPATKRLKALGNNNVILYYLYEWFDGDEMVIQVQVDNDQETIDYIHDYSLKIKTDSGTDHKTTIGYTRFYNWYFSEDDLKKYYDQHEAYYKSTYESRKKKSSSSSSSNSSSSGDYDVKSYSDPSDFYDDHETDFEDYSEAEDYYYDYN